MNLVELAQRIKKIRTEKGLTLEQTAAAAGLTRGWLWKVENFRVTPSLPALSGIASGLNVSVIELLEGLEEKPPLAVVRRADRRSLRRDEEISNYKYESLAHARPNRRMDPFILEIGPDDDRPLLSHGGEEFMLILEGRVRLEHGSEAVELEPGDAAYFDGPVPHRVVCLTDSPATAVIVYHGILSDAEVRADSDT